MQIVYRMTKRLSQSIGCCSGEQCVHTSRVRRSIEQILGKFNIRLTLTGPDDFERKSFDMLSRRKEIARFGEVEGD